MSTVEERFWAKVDKTETCWVWTASCGHGYGRFSRDGKTLRAHRVAYELLVGPIPEGLTLDHLCRNRGCVNPAHLEPVTVAENTLRGMGTAAQHARQTHCVNGHEFTPENTYQRPSRADRAERSCKACARLRNGNRKSRARG